MRHFLIIGAQRCGTTYLRRQLAAHPQIAMAEPARPEPKAFLGKEFTSLAEYQSAFFAHAGPEQLLGEKSTSYLERPDAIARAQAVLGDHRVIAQLRDPIERAVSNWAFSVDSGLETRSLEQAFADELAGRRPQADPGISVSPFAYLERGEYARCLKPWMTHYRDRLLVQFLGSPIASTYTFLGVNPEFIPDAVDQPVNQAQTTSPGLGSSWHDRLREHFAPHDDQLADLLGEPAPWRS